MGILAPFYIAGILAIGLPILFHMIRRHPQGKQAFSSLMFLSPSPPRLTKRSRLNNILLLILRALAITVLAIAFARPFLNSLADQPGTPTTGRRIGILIDTSASMRRGDLWTKAQQKAADAVDKVSPTDQVALFTFDDQVHPLFTFEEWNQTDPGLRKQLLKGRLASAKPGWSSTQIGEALATVADMVNESDHATTSSAASSAADKMPRNLILISDMQDGGHAKTLEGHQWPDNVMLDVQPVALDPKIDTGNANLEWVKQTTDDADKAEALLRVRVNNEAGSKQENFTLAWANAQGTLAGAEPLKVYVAPGTSQIVQMPWPATEAPDAVPASAPAQAAPQEQLPRLPATAPATAPAASHRPDRLVLSGDSFDFDNTLYVVPPHAEMLRVVYVGDDPATDLNGLRYYLQSALADTPRRKVEIDAHPAIEPLTDAALAGARLVVVGAMPAPESVDRLKRLMDNGGDVFWVLRTAADAKTVCTLMGIDAPAAQDMTTGFALISRVDVTHPLFAPFADARFSDFTKIHFWRHRQLKLPEQSGVHVLASFDDGSPFLMEKGIGRGWLRVATSGWDPADSQLALSTKFVPLVEGLVKRRDRVSPDAQYVIHEPVGLPEVAASTPAAGTAATNDAPRAIIFPDGKRVDLKSTVTTFDATDLPGIYRLATNNTDVPVAVNLAADESRNMPLTTKDDLSALGAKLGDDKTMAQAVLAAHQMKIAELENRQKLWRWLILGVLGLLGIETLLAGQLARRASRQEAAV